MAEPILIALLALIGSALGGFASPVLLRMLDRRYAREDRVLDAAGVRSAEVRASLQELSDNLVAWVMAYSHDQDLDDYYLRLVGVHQRVQLLIEKDDSAVAEALADRLANIVSADTANEARASLIGEMNSALVVWYRGGDAEDVKKLLAPHDTP